MDELLNIPSHVKCPEIKFISQNATSYYYKFKNVKDIIDSKQWEVYSQFYEFDKYELEIDITETDEDKERYNKARQDEEYEKCVRSFPYFCHKYVKIFHPLDGLIPCILYKFQRNVIKQYEKKRFNILSKFRQGGLTTTAVLWSLWRCMFRTDQKILLVSKTDREAIDAGEISRRALENLPTWLKPQMDAESKHEKVFKESGSQLNFYTPEAARGKSCTVIIVDEAAFIPDMETHWAAIFPVISTGGACIIISTVNGLGNWYEETYHAAEAKQNPFNVITIDYWEHPDYCDKKWAMEMRANLGERRWQQEILRNFLGSGETYIPAHIITDLMDQTRYRMPLRILMPKWCNRDDLEHGWEKGALWIWKEPYDGHEYIIGVDCAEGVSEDGDNSAFHVLDMETLEQVAEFYSNIITPNPFAQVLDQIGKFYNSALIVIESNGVGSAVVSALHLGLNYDNLYFGKTKSDHINLNKPGIKIGPANRNAYLEALQNRLIAGTLGINSIRFVHELKTFIYHRMHKRAEALKGRHDDTIMAMCATLMTRDILIHDLPVGMVVPEETTKVFKSDVYEEIRQEILRGSPEDLFAEDSDPLMPFMDSPDEEIDEKSPGLVFEDRRKNSWLLKEFSF
jgi:hypothetical protein